MRKLSLIIVLGLIILLTGGYIILKNKGMAELVTNPKNLTGIPAAIKPGKDLTNQNLVVADCFNISIYKDNLPGARDLVTDPNDNLLVSLTSSGKVVSVVNGKVVIDKLNKPHGLAFYKNKLYVAETNQVAMYDYDPINQLASNKKKIVDLPGGGNHYSRSIIFRDDKLYISTGSSCNVCKETDQRRASIWVANPDGSDFSSYAQGLRNSVFMTLNPTTNDIWATDMGRDLLGDDTPPEEINIIKQGGHYGWPYCYANQVVDEQTNPNSSQFNCLNSIKPHIIFQAHSAPLGLAFFENDLLVAYHGSWNRSQPTGYKVVRFKLDKNGNKTQEEDFVTGWLKENQASGRPVDILVKGKQIFISDDKAGVVYLIEAI